MPKSVFIFVWCLTLLMGYFSYFSSESIYQLGVKQQLLADLEIKNYQLWNDIQTYPSHEISVEKQNYFIDMGYLQKNQVIVDIKLPSIQPNPSELTTKSFSPEFIINQDNLSPILFFFFLSVFVIIFFIFYYQKNN